MQKAEALKDFFKTHPKAAIAFSGGTDSGYLLAAAVRSGADVRPYYIKTAFQPQFELEDALRLTKELGVKPEIITADILNEADVALNRADRCYRCKRFLFSLLKERAVKDGYHLILDGTNASDDADDRPGMKALRELNIQSPLRLCGITKDEVRILSKREGLFTWNKSAYACLATRVPCGTIIKAETLALVERAETNLAKLGFSDFRIRIRGGAALLQVPEAQMEKVLQKKEDIRALLANGFSSVMLDLKAR